MLPHVLDPANINIESTKLLGHDYAIKHQVLPIKHNHERLWVAVSNQNNTDILTDMSDITGMFIVPVFVDPNEIRRCINLMLAPDAINVIASQFLVDAQLDQRVELHNPEVLAEISSAPAVRLIDSLIETSILNRASDIHIEPYGNLLRVRSRVDGHLQTTGEFNISILTNTISRLKIMGGMDISEKRRPQDGRFTMEFGTEKIEFRLSTLPTTTGEKAVIRLLYGKLGHILKTDLGFFSDDLQQLSELFYKLQGAIFVTGPTGSGKSTTLSSFMMELNCESRNIISLEDPVENPIMGISHVNVERATGFSFASALRHILRQDPDVIMVGEIRDDETARIVTQAAITGHLVLSTLHTNDAAGVVERLLDMGIEPYLLASALSGVISQRLVRRICNNCKKPAELTAQQADLIGVASNAKIYKGAGCNYCNNTGYKGRLAVYEYIIITDDIRRNMSIHPYELAIELRKVSTFAKNAAKQLLAGNTSVEEILRIL